MQQMKRLAAGLALLVLVSGCARLTGSFQYDGLLAEAEALSQPQGSFNEFLRQEYIDGCYMAKDSAIDSDWHTAALFARKAIAAGQGNPPMPEAIESWEIGDPSELVTARAELVTALHDGTRETAPQEVAHAQIRFDCWVDSAAEPHNLKDFVKCREEFWETLRGLQAPTESARLGLIEP